MRIAISAEGPNLEAKVGHRLGLSQYLLIVDPETMVFEAAPNPGASNQRVAGMPAVVLAISKEVNAVLTGYCSPAAREHLSASGIEVLTGVSGTVSEVVEKYKRGKFQKYTKVEASRYTIDKIAFVHALKSSVNQFLSLLPILVGIVLFIGLFNVFVPKDLISSIFSGNMALDTLWGACFGSIFTGNPVNSYVIGGELLGYGVSLFAVTALIVSWVTVGSIQLPVEIAALGRKFALVRNGVSFALSIVIAILTVVVLNFITG